MSVTVAAWNIREGLAQPNEKPRIIEKVKSIDADVVVLSDAYSLENHLHGSDGETLTDARAELNIAGYAVQMDAEYSDSEEWWHDRHVIMLSRLAVKDSAQIRLATRNALEVVINDPQTQQPMRIVGAHFDDRRESIRTRQIASFVDRYVGDFTSTVLAGDLNTARATTRLARVARSRALDAVIPMQEGNKARRLMEILSADSLRTLEAEGYRDVDPHQKSTFPARFPFLRPDHILIPEQLKAWSVHTDRDVRASDHAAVIATLGHSE